MKKYGYLQVFIIAALTSAIIFLPAMIWDRGYFIFLGDFNSQQIAFYRLLHRAVRAGNFGWNWDTDLGVNLIGSYSFYTIGSPFFWLTVPFPEAWVSYFMGPLLILKFACCAVTSFGWLKRHVKNPEFALIGALLYAFSGYSIYNIFFNHFHDAMVFFPLLLIALDELMDHGTRGVFALSVFINAVVMYFFFVGEVVFVVVYFFVRVFTKSYEFTWKKFFSVAVEAVLGFMMSLFIFLPAVITMLSNYRVANYADGWDVWVWANNQRLYVILSSFLFPNDLPSKQVLFPDSSVKWTSLAAYLPMFSISGVVAFFRTRKKSWLKTLIIVLFVMALVPGLNSLFVAYNKAFYARWYYMFILMMALASVKVLDEGHVEEMERSVVRVLIATAVLVLIFALTPDKLKDGTWRLGLFADDAVLQFAIICVFSLVGPSVLLVLLDILPKDRTKFVRKLALSLCIICALYGNFYVIWGKTRSYDTHAYFIPDVMEGTFEDDTDEFYRIDQDDSVINLGMFWGVPDIQAFHSLVPASITEFYNFFGEKRSVKSVPSYDIYPVRAMLSVRYFIDSHDEGDDFIMTNGDPRMPGYLKIGEQNDHDIYKNTHYIPMGFTYGMYCTEKEARKVEEKDRAMLMLACLIVPDDQVDYYEDVLTHYKDVDELDLDDEAYVDYCAARSAHVARSFTIDNHGFTAEMVSDKETAVFFSVPYEKGWSAEVNGKKAEIIKSNIGFMSVKIPEGKSVIRFTYQTPGLKIGLYAAGAAAILLIGYIILLRKKVH